MLERGAEYSKLAETPAVQLMLGKSRCLSLPLDTNNVITPDGGAIL